HGAAGGTSLDLAASGHTEVEYCVQIRALDVVTGDSIQLRVSDTQANLASWTQTPTITASGGAAKRPTFSDNQVINDTPTFSTIIADHYLSLIDLDALPLADSWVFDR